MTNFKWCLCTQVKALAIYIKYLSKSPSSDHVCKCHFVEPFTETTSFLSIRSWISQGSLHSEVLAFCLLRKETFESLSYIFLEYFVESIYHSGGKALLIYETKSRNYYTHKTFFHCGPLTLIKDSLWGKIIFSNKNSKSGLITHSPSHKLLN